MTLKIAIASDHAGYSLKAALIAGFDSTQVTWVDLGTDSGDVSVDYPDYGHKLAKAVADKQVDFGVAICGSGVGISIAVNRNPSVRCVLCADETTARLARQHNDANVIAFGARLIGVETAKACLEVFLKTEFEGGRHQNRVAKLSTC
jgi:ribose 5-phosphate isomerase B